MRSDGLAWGAYTRTLQQTLSKWVIREWQVNICLEPVFHLESYGKQHYFHCHSTIKLRILDGVTFSMYVGLKKIISLAEDNLSLTCFSSLAPTWITDNHEFPVASRGFLYLCAESQFHILGWMMAVRVPSAENLASVLRLLLRWMRRCFQHWAVCLWHSALPCLITGTSVVLVIGNAYMWFDGLWFSFFFLIINLF